MNQKRFYCLILACNVLLLFVYIFKQNSLISLRHQLQKQELLSTQLHHKRELLFNDLKKLQQHTTIKKRAEQELGLRKTHLKQIISVPSGIS